VFNIAEERLTGSMSLPSDDMEESKPDADGMDADADDGEPHDSRRLGSLNGCLAMSDDGQWAAAIAGSGAHVYSLDAMQVRHGVGGPG
jgi:hypothetical protein